jgi:hypothetical protein
MKQNFFTFACEMKQLCIYLLMFIHLNVALVPHLNEMDKVNPVTNAQLEDINSFVELIRIVLGYDTTADDEDNDTADNGQVPVNHIYVCPQLEDYRDILNKHCFLQTMRLIKPFNILLFFPNTAFDIDAPPPEA